MPGPITPDLIQTLVQRELRNNPPAEERSFNLGLSPGMRQPTPMKPEKLATIGALADIAGTYAGLKLHGGREDNTMLANQGPKGVALGLVAQLLAQKGLTHLIRKKAPAVADALAANTGAAQLGLGSEWGRILHGEPNILAGHEIMADAHQRNQMQMQPRIHQK